MSVLSVSYVQIPSYLHSSSFYASLNAEDQEGELQVPFECFKADDSVTNFKDLIHMLFVDRYWGLSSIPDSVLRFFFELDTSTWPSVLTAITEQDQLPLLSELSDLFLCADRLLTAIMSCKRPEIARFLAPLGKAEDRLRNDFCHAAAKVGNLACLALLHQHGYSWDEYTCNTAAENGHVHCLKYAHENGCPWDRFTSLSAACRGHFDCIVYAHQQGLRWTPEVCGSAAIFGHLDCLRYSHENGCPWDVNTLLEAARAGHLDCLQYACEQGLEWSDDVASAAAEAGHLPCLQYLHENGCPWDDYVTLNAACGHEDCLRYALEHGCPVHDSAAHIAANYIDCLKLLHTYNVEWDDRVTGNAASAGNLECLQYLHEHGCPWTVFTALNAASRGSQECLLYALEHGCEHNDEVLQIVAALGLLSCAKYLLEERGVQLNEDGQVFATALICGQSGCVEYLLSKNCPLGMLQNGAHSHPTTEYENVYHECEKESPVLDADTLQCMKLAREGGWLWDDVFVRFINDYSYLYPLCYEYMASECAAFV